MKEIATRLSAAEADRLLLETSGKFDAARYRRLAGLPVDADAVEHYLSEGWRRGLEPCNGIDGEFLQPYYESAGYSGPPILTWLELSACGEAPATRADAERLAARVRSSGLFDEAAYAKRLAAGLDPALHYVLIGEHAGWAPSDRLDPAFYRDRHPDVAAAGASPLLHFEECGSREQRRPLPAAAHLLFPELRTTGRRAVLVLLHDASRTGAPVLGWNIARHLAARYDVVAVLLNGGELEKDFSAVCAAVVGPLTRDNWHVAEAERLAERLATIYDPLYAVANSIETRFMIRALATRGVPSVALVHEFTYYRPVDTMRDAYDWAPHVVFPARLVAKASFEAFPALALRRGVHVITQGQVDLPPRPGKATAKIADIRLAVRPYGAEDAFVVLGLGFVHFRKGVDLFLACAAAVRRREPGRRFRFVWIGDGYDPDQDLQYSIYLAEQIARSGLDGNVAFFNAVEDLEPAYAAADAFFMCSRLDPQPNVSIDAMTRGLPVVCFDGASGTSEILAADPETSWLVVPHLDAHAAADVIGRLARDSAVYDAARRAVKRVGDAAFDMTAYLNRLDALGCAAAAAQRPQDLQTLVDSAAVDAALALPPDVLASVPDAAERYVIAQWATVGTSPGQIANAHFRRPCPGFHPQIYALAHADECGEGGQHPLAHWLRAGRPPGPWSRRVLSPLQQPLQPTGAAPRLALHGHFFHVETAYELAAKLACNNTECDLLLSTDTAAKADSLRAMFAASGRRVEVQVMPNRGRDIGPFLTGFADRWTADEYDVVGHVHGKRSPIDAAMGHNWREFLFQHLIGGEFAMLDLIAAAFASDPGLGLLQAEDPHLVGWDNNQAIAENLAARMGLSPPLPTFFDFPVGSMFWARPQALRPLLDLGLNWNDYPEEPLPYDGTLLHALERLVPFAVGLAGFETAVLRIPESTW